MTLYFIASFVGLVIAPIFAFRALTADHAEEVERRLELANSRKPSSPVLLLENHSSRYKNGEF